MSDAPGQRRIQELRAMPYEKYLKTPEWLRKRDQALERDGYSCRACNSDKKLNVHHRTYAGRGNESLNDLTTLCESCHEHFHKKISQDEIMVRTYPIQDVPVSKEVQAQKQEEYLVGLLIQNQSLYPHVCGLLSEDDFTSPDARTLYSLLGRSSSSDQPFEQLVPSDLKNAVSQIAELVKPKSAIDKVADVKTVINIVSRIRRAITLQKNEELQNLIREAAQSGDKITERQLRKQVFENKNLLYVTYLSGGQS